MNNQYTEPTRILVHKVEKGRVVEITEDTEVKLPKVKAYRFMDKEMIKKLIASPIKKKYVDAEGNPIEDE